MAKSPQRNTNEILGALKHCRNAFIPVIVASFFINLLMFVVPLYMLQVYDRVLTTHSTDTLIMMSVMAGVGLIAYGLMEFARSRLLVRAGIRLDELMNSRVFGAVFQSTLRRPGQGGSAQNMRDFDSIREFLTSGGLIAFFDAPWVPLFIAVGFLLHPIFGFIGIAGAVIILALALINEFTTRKALRDGSQSSILANNYMSASLRNAEAASAMGMMGGIRQRWDGHHREYIGNQAKASDRSGMIHAMSRTVRIGLQVAVLGTGAYLAILQEITAGTIIAASIIINRGLAPIDMAVGQWRNFVNTRYAYFRLKDLLRAIPEDLQKMSLPRPTGTLQVQGLVAAPPGTQEPVLRGLTFDLKPGELLGIIGPSAAGKSSLARVMVGAWPVNGGVVRLDESEIDHWDREELGRHLGYLPQDVELFDGTVAENIARFSDGINAEAVLTAAHKAGVHGMIAQLPDGYNTQIGAGGQVLSGGQRQRIALARALYGDPAFIVLDEPNSNLDSEGEHALANALQILKSEGRTTVVITHKPNLLAQVDKVMIMKGGQRELFGPRDEVLSKVLRPAPVGSHPGGPDQVSPPQEGRQLGSRAGDPGGGIDRSAG
jgi:PrtD family type I secretion system ABC transporter